MQLPDLVQHLRRSLPGVDEPWERDLAPDLLLLRLAAVAVLLFPRDGQAWLLLTKRPDTMRSHAGQMAFPGGRVELGDPSPWAAALREAHEEIGVPGEEVTAVGRLEPIQIPASNHLVLPFVGCLAGTPHVTPHTAEVEAVVEVPVSDLLSRDNVGEDTWALRIGALYRVTYYRLGGQVVWGATARILGDLAQRIGVTWEQMPGSVRPAAE